MTWLPKDPDRSSRTGAWATVGALAIIPGSTTLSQTSAVTEVIVVGDRPMRGGRPRTSHGIVAGAFVALPAVHGGVYAEGYRNR